MLPMHPLRNSLLHDHSLNSVLFISELKFCGELSMVLDRLVLYKSEDHVLVGIVIGFKNFLDYTRLYHLAPSL